MRSIILDIRYITRVHAVNVKSWTDSHVRLNLVEFHACFKTKRHNIAIMSPTTTYWTYNRVVGQANRFCELLDLPVCLNSPSIATCDSFDKKVEENSEERTSPTAARAISTRLSARSIWTRHDSRPMDNLSSHNAFFLINVSNGLRVSFYWKAKVTCALQKCRTLFLL